MNNIRLSARHGIGKSQGKGNILNRSERRKLERGLLSLMTRDGDRCSVCGRGFDHLGQTYHGLAADGRPAIAGECCKHRVNTLIRVGLYLSVKVSEDNAAADIARRAGVDGVAMRAANCDATKDDSRWFAANPTRSHRWRPPYPGEMAEREEGVPSDFEPVVLVRQVEPGIRVRRAMRMPPDFEIRDDDAVLHAFFDLADPARRSRITVQELKQRLAIYSSPYRA